MGGMYPARKNANPSRAAHKVGPKSRRMNRAASEALLLERLRLGLPLFTSNLFPGIVYDVLNRGDQETGAAFGACKYTTTIFRRPSTMTAPLGRSYNLVGTRRCP